MVILCKPTDGMTGYVACGVCLFDRVQLWNHGGKCVCVLERAGFWSCGFYICETFSKMDEILARRWKLEMLNKTLIKNITGCVHSEVATCWFCYDQTSFWDAYCTSNARIVGEWLIP